MQFRVEITNPALGDAEEYFRFIRDTNKEPDAADRWLSGLMSAIDSLEHSPARCSIIPEQFEFPFEIRQLIYFSHRIIFRIDTARGCVTVYRVYPGAKRSLSRRDLL